jgi:precorrin-6Y C5,15-methyltransferase (decarboxylating)
VLYAVTGSPIFYSSTTSLLNYIDKEIPGFDKSHVTIIPAESSMDYMLRKLRIPANNVMPISLHGRTLSKLDLTRILALEYTFILCDETTIHQIASLLYYVSEYIDVYIGSRLGSPEETFQKIELQSFCAKYDINEIKSSYMPCVLLIKRNYETENTMTANETIYTKAGMLTKIDKRALTLQALTLKPNQVLWDVGAGSGSISIDAFKLFKCRTILFEKKEVQCQFIKQNLQRHKLIAATLFEGNVLDNIQKAETPDRIFIGGGGEEVLSSIDKFYDLLKVDGLIVINIVGLENLSTLLIKAQANDYHYEVRSIDITNYQKMESASRLSIGESKRTLYQIIIYKKNEL